MANDVIIIINGSIKSTRQKIHEVLDIIEKSDFTGSYTIEKVKVKKDGKD